MAKNSDKHKQEVESISELMDAVIADNGVPRNIRKSVEEAKNKINKDSEDLGVTISAAIYYLDDISNDINMPSHTRTEIWTIISELENLKERLK
jgi:uncharacterized protein